MSMDPNGHFDSQTKRAEFVRICYIYLQFEWKQLTLILVISNSAKIGTQYKY